MAPKCSIKIDTTGGGKKPKRGNTCLVLGREGADQESWGPEVIKES